MIRIAGILCGSATAISVLIIALGMPELLPETGDNSGMTTAPAGVTEAATPPIEIPQPALDSLPVPEIASLPPAEEGLAPVEPATQPAWEQTYEAEPPTLQPTFIAQEIEPPVASENWYAFWSPFRSEIAANGFVSRLQQTTGLDYRVIRSKPGVYEVAFMYAVETEIEAKLAAISAATGLDLPGG